MATELGKAYVQIVPSARGISGSIQKQIDPEASSAGSSAGFKLGKALSTAVVAAAATAVAGLSAIIAGSITEGAKLEQSLGGVETLFKENADRVKKYASEGYKTAGLSANAYMENVTGFAASMVNSLGGDTKKAADLSNQALIDMSDNANKFGTDMGQIAYTYQGFAKQNYTMLDNLKLGYGGTKAEMERLLADAEKLSGVKYDISSFAEVTQAIHVIQKEMGITGTTAQEAAQTFSGSFAAMAASAQNVFGGLATGFNLEPALKALVTTSSTFLFDNLIPMVGNVIKALPGAITTFSSEAGKVISERFGIGIGSGLSGIGPKVMKAIDPIVQGFKTAFWQLPGLFNSVVSTIGPIIGKIGEAFTKLDFSGIQSLISKIIPAVQTGFSTMMSIVGPAIEKVVESFKNMWNAAQPLISILAGALMPAFQVIGSFLGGVFKGILSGVSFAFDAIGKAITILTPVVSLLVSGFRSIAPVLSNIATWVGTVVGMFTGLGGAGGSLRNILTGAWNGIRSAIQTAGNVISSVINVARSIFTAFGAAGGTLRGVLSTAWNAIRSVISGAGSAISGAVNGIRGFFSGFSGAGNSLRSVLSSAWNGITSVISNARNTISGIINSIKGIFNSLFNVNLSGAGSAIINGFLGGLQAGFDKVKGFVGGIADWIKKNKGPISYDKKLLIPAGKAIMNGLNSGLQDQFKSVKKTVSGIAQSIQQVISDEIDTSIFPDDPWDPDFDFGRGVPDVASAQRAINSFKFDQPGSDSGKTEIQAPMTVIVRENPSEREIARQQKLQFQRAGLKFV